MKGASLACILIALVAQPPIAPQNNLVYEIFVRSFADGDKDAKGIGDLKGIVSELDPYLNDGDPNTLAPTFSSGAMGKRGRGRT